ncbi:hypothetical protein ABPG72_019806 [Tetrahymena utriculariae]
MPRALSPYSRGIVEGHSGQKTIKFKNLNGLPKEQISALQKNAGRQQRKKLAASYTRKKKQLRKSCSNLLKMLSIIVINSKELLKICTLQSIGCPKQNVHVKDILYVFLIFMYKVVINKIQRKLNIFTGLIFKNQ